MNRTSAQTTRQLRRRNSVTGLWEGPSIEIAISVDYIWPLLNNTLSNGERAAQTFRIATTVIHEMAVSSYSQLSWRPDAGDSREDKHRRRRMKFGWLFTGTNTINHSMQQGKLCSTPRYILDSSGRMEAFA